MADTSLKNTWQSSPDDIIILVNNTASNYILELPTGQYRLDAGRRMRTLRTIMKVPQIKALVENGKLSLATT